MERRLVGLIGANIMKSLSPPLIEDCFAAAGMRGHYHLMDLDRLPGRRLADLLEGAKATGFIGLNITRPCKEEVIPLLDAVSPDNPVVIHRVWNKLVCNTAALRAAGISAGTPDPPADGSRSQPILVETQKRKAAESTRERTTPSAPPRSMP